MFLELSISLKTKIICSISFTVSVVNILTILCSEHPKESLKYETVSYACACAFYFMFSHKHEFISDIAVTMVCTLLFAITSIYTQDYDVVLAGWTTLIPIMLLMATQRKLSFIMSTVIFLVFIFI